MRVAILDDYLHCARDLADWSRIEERAEITVFTEPFGSAEETVEALADFDILCLMRDRTPLPARTLAGLPKCRFITFPGKKNNTLDLPAALAQGIAVSRGDGAVNEATTELAWALIMATVRQLPANEASLRRGEWHTSLGTVLHGKTFGILGLGRIGIPVARYAQAFGMSVIAWSRSLTDEAAAAVGARRVDHDDLFAGSDVLSVHVPLTAGTRGLVGARELGLMKPTAFLVNTSRGPIVDEAALAHALHEGVIAGAGLDVYDVEPLPLDSPLLAAPNAVLLPHLGFVARENMEIFYREAVENIEAWLAGAPIRQITEQ
jgi:phosphoglycerate dehydrogenase-like enzyme